MIKLEVKNNIGDAIIDEVGELNFWRWGEFIWSQYLSLSARKIVEVARLESLGGMEL